MRLLGKDAIPAILEPEFVSASEAGYWMEPDEAVLGVSMGGEHKAYPVIYAEPTRDRERRRWG